MRFQRLAVEVLEDRLMLSGDNLANPVISSVVLRDANAGVAVASSSSAPSGPLGGLAAVSSASFLKTTQPVRKHATDSSSEAADYAGISSANGGVGSPSTTSVLRSDKEDARAVDPDQSAGSQPVGSPAVPDEDDDRYAPERAEPQDKSTDIQVLKIVSYVDSSAEEASGDVRRGESSPSGAILSPISPVEEPVSLHSPAPVATDLVLPATRRPQATVNPAPEPGESNILGPDVPLPRPPVPSDSNNAPLDQTSLHRSEPEVIPWHLLSEALVPYASTLPIDLNKLRQNVDSFFGRLGHVGEEALLQHASTELIPWLMVATALAYEFARARDRSLVHRLASRGAVAAELELFTAKDE